MKSETFKRRAAITIILFLINIVCVSQTLTYPIVDTNSKDYYNNEAIITIPQIGEEFYGQDANYSGNQPSYTNNEDGTITDNITGLMWEKDMGEKISYFDAFTKANNSTLADYSDWRVPTIKELYSLIQFSGSVMGAETIEFFIDTTYFNQPIGNTDIGEREIDAQTWSSTQYVGLTMNGDTTVFGVNFIDGRIKGYPKYQPPTGTVSMTMYFRMVRGNSDYGTNSFIDNGDGTITDNATGLMWQQADDGVPRDWENSLSYAENLSLAGHSDWRLPNAKELHSIVDYTRSPQTSDSPAINPIFSVTQITDPDGNTEQYPYFWTSTSHLDGVNPYSSAVYFAFGEAQGEMNGSLMDVHGAGAQRSDPKSGSQEDYPQFFGPQGDVRYVFNYVRCVRDASISTSINDSDNIDFSFSVYPNPAKNGLTISSDSDLKAINIYNSIGQKVLSLNPNQKDIHVNTSKLSAGIYFINLKTNDGISSIKKLIVTK